MGPDETTTDNPETQQVPVPHLIAAQLGVLGGDPGQEGLGVLGQGGPGGQEDPPAHVEPDPLGPEAGPGLALVAVVGLCHGLEVEAAEQLGRER